MTPAFGGRGRGSAGDGAPGEDSGGWRASGLAAGGWRPCPASDSGRPARQAPGDPGPDPRRPTQTASLHRLLGMRARRGSVRVSPKTAPLPTQPEAPPETTVHQTRSIDLVDGSVPPLPTPPPTKGRRPAVRRGWGTGAPRAGGVWRPRAQEPSKTTNDRRSRKPRREPNPRSLPTLAPSPGRAPPAPSRSPRPPDHPNRLHTSNDPSETITACPASTTRSSTKRTRTIPPRTEA